MGMYLNYQYNLLINIFYIILTPSEHIYMNCKTLYICAPFISLIGNFAKFATLIFTNL